MKVLAVSILRLGDILMMVPVLRALKDQNENVELHVLINRQFNFVRYILPWVDKFIVLDREELQKGLGEYNRPIFEPLDRISAVIDFLNRQNYDKIVNLSHSRFSGFICGMIDANEKLGLSINRNNTVSFGNKWYSYMNEQCTLPRSSSAHLLDVHYYGSGLTYSPYNFDYRISARGEAEADAILESNTKFICVQVLTSDVKKNWGYDNFAESLKVFKMTNPNIAIYSLGAPSESQDIADFIRICEERGVKVVPAICSLEGALSILSRCELLITGDTSIKHLACGVDCSILEIAVGSSDFLKTGVYKSQSYIVSSREACYPCIHSQSCHQPTHVCSNSIEPAIIGLLANQILIGASREIEIVAKEYNDKVVVHRTYFSHSGFWYVRNLAEKISPKDFESVIKLSSWKLLNQGEHHKLVGAYGSESIKLKAALRQAYPEAKIKEKKHFLTGLESTTIKKGEAIYNLKTALRRATNSSRILEDIKSNYQILSDELSPNFANEVLKFFENYDGDGSKNFLNLRKYSETLENVFIRNQIQLKLLRNMIGQTME